MAEAVPAPVAAHIHDLIDIPVIGIGAGPDVDGQVLVLHDLAGFSADSPPVRAPVRALREALRDAVGAYVDDVRAGTFPTAEHTYPISDDELAAFQELAAGTLPP